MSCLVYYNLCFSFRFFNHGVFSSFLIKEFVCASGIFHLSLINQDNTVVLSQGRFQWFLKGRITRGFKPYVPIQSIDRSKKVGVPTPGTSPQDAYRSIYEWIMEWTLATFQRLIIYCIHQEKACWSCWLKIKMYLIFNIYKPIRVVTENIHDKICLNTNKWLRSS